MAKAGSGGVGGLHLLVCLVLSSCLPPMAEAAGYYNFGMHWKGGLNPYRLGADFVFQSGFTSGSGTSSVSGTGDGMTNAPGSVAVDSSGNLYVTDYNNSRINKYDSSGVFQGWIGNIATSPTGGTAGCNGATVGTFTPGWCKGGTSSSGTGDGMMDHPTNVEIDSSGNIYVVDTSNNRINKYNASGVFQGWIGLVDTSPTGGAAGCSSAAFGTATPGWCTGGTSFASPGLNGDGRLNRPSAIALDSSGNLYIADYSNHRIVKYNSAGAFQGWIGKIATSPTGGAAGCSGATVGTFTPGWCKGGTSASGTGDGMMNGPVGLAFDSSGNLYVADSNNSRINRYNSSGAFQGWIGKIATSPTGGATGCNGAVVGTATPGWCTGGTSTLGTGDGMLSGPTGIVLDPSDNLYVVESSGNRMSKFNSSGVFLGWIGKIATSPTGGATNCNGAVVGAVTPGWCTGGTSTSGSGDGMMNLPYDIARDLSGNLYVADSQNHRINKYSSSGAAAGALQSTGQFFSWHRSVASPAPGVSDGMMNAPHGVSLDLSGNIYVADYSNHRINKYNSAGAFQGWIGNIATSPTGGAAGCNGATVGTFTPGWCKGGTSASGTGDGMMNHPTRVVVDLSGNIYVADYSNHRINKYNSAGAFQGWIGNIATSPTGGAAGCNGATVGTFTPGWCKGGTSASGTGDGMMNAPAGIGLDSSGNLYVVDAGQNRVNKYNSSGAFQGWIGMIGTSPTGGAPGCNGASVSTVTPGWCTGGAPKISVDGVGGLQTPIELVLDASGNLYVTNSGVNIIDKYNSSGAFQGWIGQISVSPTGGATGCNGAAVGTSTPGWCIGGGGSSGTEDGMLSGPNGLATDSSGNLYVADSNNHRISKYNSAGAFQGWIGNIATSPTGGATGCNGAAADTFTPGWCKGGTSASGTGDGMMTLPYGMAVDSSGNLFVADAGNHRIIRFSIQGK